MKVSSILVISVIIKLHKMDIFRHILSLNMKVSDILVTSVIIKERGGTIFGHIFSLNIMLFSIPKISGIIKLHSRVVFRDISSDLHLLGDGYNEAEDREGLLAQDSCVDNHNIGNCKLVVKTRYCGNKYVLCQVLLQVLHPGRWGMKKQRELFPGQIPYK